MLKNFKQVFFALITVLLLVVIVPTGTVEAQTKDGAKLTKSDFAFKVGSKKQNFFTKSKNDQTYYYVFWSEKETKECKSSSEKLVTNRNVSLGSSASLVQKKYGKAKKYKYNSKGVLEKQLKYNIITSDYSTWKTYLEYTYKKGNDEYRIRFYFNQKNKVAGIVYLKNLDEFYNFPSKEIKTGLKFVPPAGKKITTKKIGGKTVYLVPKGSKIKFDKKKSNIGAFDYYFSMYDEYGDFVGHTDLDGYGWYGETSVSKSTIDETLTIVPLWGGEKNVQLDINNLGNYRYFVFIARGTDDLAPQVIYFRIV